MARAVHGNEISDDGCLEAVWGHRNSKRNREIACRGSRSSIRMFGEKVSLANSASCSARCYRSRPVVATRTAPSKVDKIPLEINHKFLEWNENSDLTLFSSLAHPLPPFYSTNIRARPQQMRANVQSAQFVIGCFSGSFETSFDQPHQSITRSSPLSKLIGIFTTQHPAPLIQ